MEPTVAKHMPVDLGLSDPDNDPNEARIAAAFQQLVNSEITPASAASVVDETITRDCTEALAAYKKTPEEAKNASPAGWQKYVWDCIATAAMKLPASHQGQDRLVEFVDELKRLPRHKVPAVHRSFQKIDDKELWVLTRKNGYDYFEQWLWERKQGMPSSERTEESLNASANYAAFVARLLGQGTAAIFNFCPLVPMARQNIATLKTADIPGFEHTVIAAAQWILYAGQTLQEMCRRKVLAGLRWKSAVWDNIRGKFDAVAQDERFLGKVRDYAKQAADRMRAIEAEQLTEASQAEQARIVDAHEFLDVTGPDDGASEEDED